MKYVYLLQSILHPDQRYVGLTDNLQQRLATHNQSGSPHSSKFAPWHIVTTIRFDIAQRASAFERYLNPDPAELLPIGIYGNSTFTVGAELNFQQMIRTRKLEYRFEKRRFWDATTPSFHWHLLLQFFKPISIRILLKSSFPIDSL